MTSERKLRGRWRNIRLFNGVGAATFLLFAFVGTSAPTVFADIPVSPSVALEEKNALETSIGVAVGIDGVYKNGFPTQVVVSWEGVGEFAGSGSESESAPDAFLRRANQRRVVENVELETVDSDGAPFVVSRPTTTEEQASGRAETLAIFPKATGKLTVRLRLATGEIAEKTLAPTKTRSNPADVCLPPAVSSEPIYLAEKTLAPTKTRSNPADVFLPPAVSSKPIYLVVGDPKNESLGVSEAFGNLRWKEDRRPNVVYLSDFSAAPTDFRALEAVERLILTTTDPNFFDGIGADDPRLKAIERWVERGGDVVLLAGEKSVPLLTQDGGALAFFSPGARVAEKTHEFRVVNSLVVDLKNVKNLALSGSRAFPFLNVPVVSDLKPNAIVEMREAETPLLVARPFGLGSIVFFASDLAIPPFSNWSGRGTLWLKILGFDAERADGASIPPSFVERGFNDLSGQLRGALDVFEGVRVVPFSLVLTAIFVFLLAIGPFDWFFVKKFLKKPSATWATFPIYVVACCVLVVWTTNVTRPNASLLNRAETLDVDAESGIVRDVSWFGLYSPDGRPRSLSIEPNWSVPTTALVAGETVASLAPLTLDGDGVGGSEEKTVATRIWSEPYRMETSSAALVDVPTATRSSKSFVGRWTSRATGLPAPGTIVDDGLTLRGTIVNPFDVPIYSAFIVYPGGAYSLGVLPPGESTISRSAPRLEPRRVLNEHQSSVPTERLDRWDATTYNFDSTRVPYILRVLSFYRFAGGEETFGIAKRLQGDVDLSDSLRCGRAVIFGTIVDSEAEKYRPIGDVRKAADALERERLDKEIAERAGRRVQSPEEAAREKYGDFGSSSEFAPTSTTLNDASNDAIQGKRTVVVRLVVPLTRGQAPASSTP